MNAKLQSALDDLRARLQPTLAYVRAHRFWFECGTVTLLLIVLAAAIARSSMRRAELLEREALRLEMIQVGVDRWTEDLQPPGPEEASAWRESREMVERLAEDAPDPLRTTHGVAARAEEIGIPDLRIRLVGADSIVPPQPVAVGAWAVEAGEPGVVAEFIGDWPTVVSFLGVLPPQVEVASLHLTPEDGELRARFHLLTRRVVSRQ